MAIKQVTAAMANKKDELPAVGTNRYEKELGAPKRRLKTNETKTYYPVTIAASDDSGNVTADISQRLEVFEKNIFPQKMISATPVGEEVGFLKNIELDLDVGDTNDFELQVGLEDWSREMLWYGFQVYMPGTEYGGLIEDMEVCTSEKRIYFWGHTWRGLLTQKVIEPPAGQDYLILSGELNTVLRALIGNRFGSLFVVDSIDTGVVVSNWKVDRYVTLYDAVVKLLQQKGYRLDIAYRQGPGLEYGAVHLQAVPVTDWSDELEYSQDNRLNFRIRDYRRGINHLICLGKGELKDRLILHLYVQKDGSIGRTRYYTGLEERVETYDFSSEEDPVKLEESGREKLQELKNYKKIEMTINDVDVEIGDIVEGRERITGTALKQPVIQKILKVSDETVTIDYKVKGDD